MRNLDLAAYERLIKNGDFQKHVIPDRAKELAILFSQTLAPLFCTAIDSEYESDWDGFATWGDEVEDFRDRRDRLNTMFQMALRLKAESCLNLEEYEMVVYQPGDLFNPNTMTPETPEGMTDIVNNHSGHVIEVTTQAAVFAYEKRPLMNSDSTSVAIITSNNFVRKSAEQRQTISPRAKATVVLKGSNN